MRLQVSWLSRAGARPANEDACGMWSSPATGACCCVVSDGAGGHAGGQIASRLVVRTVLRRFRDAPACGPEAIEAALREANEAVLDGQRRCAQAPDMRATAVVLMLDPARAHAAWGHVGDSRLYRFGAGRLAARTRDHSVLQRLVDAGYLGPEELGAHARRNALLAAVGDARGIEPCVARDAAALADGDAFLLCTDGLWQQVPEADMERLLSVARDAQDWLRALESAVLARADAAQDNYSALVVACGSAAFGAERPPSPWPPRSGAGPPA